MVHGLRCSTACGIFPGQGSNPCLLHWQVVSLSLRHQGSLEPVFVFKIRLCKHSKSIPHHPSTTRPPGLFASSLVLCPYFNLTIKYSIPFYFMLVVMHFKQSWNCGYMSVDTLHRQPYSRVQHLKSHDIDSNPGSIILSVALG